MHDGQQNAAVDEELGRELGEIEGRDRRGRDLPGNPDLVSGERTKVAHESVASHRETHVGRREVCLVAENQADDRGICI